MFVELMPLLAGRTVLITVAKVDDKTLRVNVIPNQVKPDENPARTVVSWAREFPPGARVKLMSTWSSGRRTLPH